MATGRSKKKQEETDLKNQAQAAVNEIKPSDYELYQKPLDLALLKDLDSGKDVSQIDGLRWTHNLFQNRNKGFEDTGVGLLGANELSGNANAGMLGAVREQIKARNDQDAQGALYDSVNESRGNAMARSMGFAGMEGNRNLQKADLTNQRYTSFLTRQQKPSFWQQMLMGGMQAGATLGAAAI